MLLCGICCVTSAFCQIWCWFNHLQQVSGSQCWLVNGKVSSISCLQGPHMMNLYQSLHSSRGWKSFWFTLMKSISYLSWFLVVVHLHVVSSGGVLCSLALHQQNITRFWLETDDLLWKGTLFLRQVEMAWTNFFWHQIHFVPLILWMLTLAMLMLNTSHALYKLPKSTL